MIAKGSVHLFFLEQVRITDEQTGQKWHFICNQWSSPVLGDRIVRHTLCIGDQPQQLGSRWQAGFSKKLRDDHMWLSIVTRPVTSSFTRLQRVACAFAFLFIAMLTSIMFYGKNEDPTEQQEIGLGNFSYNITDLIISVECLIITSIICIPITLMFQKSSRPLVRQAYLRSRGSGVIDLPYQSQGKKKCKCLLPTWCVYVAWFLVLSICLGGSYIIMMYSLTYGHSRSVAWAISFFSTWGMDCLIKEPVKVVLVTFVCALFLKNEVTPSESVHSHNVPLDNPKIEGHKEGAIIMEVFNHVTPDMFTI